MASTQRADQDSVRLRACWWVALVAGAVAVLVTLAGCSQSASNEAVGGAPGRGIYVEADWSRDRRVSGHRVHVEQQHIACASCHELNGAATMGAVSPTRCATCHAARSTIEHAARLAEARFGPGVHADCVNCHAFTIDSKSDPALDSADGGALEAYQPDQCARCHEQAQGHIPAVTVHATTACLSCHRPHQDAKPVSAPCVSCHSAIATSHAALGKTPNETCQTCHTHQHAPAADALATCADCHSKVEPIVPATALFAGGHSACVSCHVPHEFAAKQAVSCRSCHASVIVLGEAKVPEHAQCASCHQPHDVKQSAAASCKNCHWDVHSDHPDRAGLGGCLTCHDVHPKRAQTATIASSCSSCHRQAASDHAFHDGASCQSCHTPHHFEIKLAQHAPCQSCHQKELTLTALRTGHVACEGCHGGLPHNPGVGSAVCSTCHAAAAREVNAGHQKCLGCHEPHSGGVATPSTCKSCHQQEAATAPAGHQLCIGCHQPHSGSQVKAVCSSCHAAEAATPHGKLATGCLTCHRPHGPSGVATAPACTTCHALASLPGLHAKPQHQACANCHGGHGDAPNAARNACLTCHADRRNHFPDAPRCANCHLFQAAEPSVKAP